MWLDKSKGLIHCEFTHSFIHSHTYSFSGWYEPEKAARPGDLSRYEQNHPVLCNHGPYGVLGQNTIIF